MPSSVARKVASGAAWMVLFKFAERFLGLVSTVILVRLLTPADFGVVAMATVMIAMLELFSAFGFDTALIRDQRATPAHYHTAWTFNVLVAIAVAIVMLMAAGPIASFYREPAVFAVVCALAFSPLFGAFENIGVVAFRKDLRFKREFLYQLARKVIGFLVTVPLAFWLRSYWALVAGILASRLLTTALSYWAHPFRPRFSLTERASLFNFSKWLLLNNMAAFLKERSSDFIIGRLHGSAGLGLYSVGYELANMPTTELSAPINRALLPGFATLSADRGALLYMYRTAMSLVAFLGIPASAGIWALAHLLVPVVLGPRWLDTVPLIQILALNGVLLLFQSSICAFLIGAGHPASVARSNFVFVAMLVLLLLVLTPTMGLKGAALAALATSIVCTPLYLWILWRQFEVPPAVFIKAIVRPLAAASIMLILLHFALPQYAPNMPILIMSTWLAAGVLLGVMSYGLGAVGLWWLAGRPAGAEQVVLSWLLRAFRSRRQGASK
jgi:lipopolysaccharide exporter